MNFKDFIDLTESSFGKRKALFEKKTHDYATEDCLSNFKRVSQLCRLLKVDVGKSEGTSLFYIIMKLDRLCNLLSKDKSPMNESLDDTLSDMQNYLDLLRGLLYEKEDR